MALNVKSWFIFKIAITYTVVATGLIINFLQLLTYLLVRPFNKILYKRLNYYLGYALFAQMTAYASYWSGFELDVFCTEEDFKHLGKENSFGVPNHHYDLDWLTGWVFFERIGQLGGAKVVLKNNLKYIPVMGWAWIFSEYIFVKRVWDKDQKTLVRDLKEVLDYPKDLNFAINIFCESTRFTPEKHEACLEIAKQKGFPQFKHHLLPRPKGFTLVSSQLAGKIDYLYDLEIGVKKIVDEHGVTRDPTIMDMQHGVPIKAQILVRRIPMSTVPAGDEKKCAEYLNKLYQAKDEAFDVFDKHGDFSPLGYKKHTMPRTMSELICALASIVFVLLPSVYYFIWVVLNGSLLTKVIILSLILAMILTAKLAISKSNTKSSFGLKKSDASATTATPLVKTDLNNNSLVEEASSKKSD